MVGVCGLGELGVLSRVGELLGLGGLGREGILVTELAMDIMWTRGIGGLWEKVD